jgi:hypothetical protein
MADEFSADSHRKAVEAQQAGKFREEIVPVEIAGRKGTTVVDADEGPRADTTAESLGKLRPAFTQHAPEDVTDPVVTAGNASSMNDGASAVVVTSEEYARANGLTILARIGAYSTGAVEPKELFFAPIEAVKKLMKKQGSTISDYDLIEANEAFAVQALADGAGAGVGLGPGERARRRGRARPPDRRLRRAGAHDAAARDEGPRRGDRPGHALPGRRRRGRALGGAGLASRRGGDGAPPPERADAVLYGPYGLRSGWRILLFVALALLIASALGWLWSAFGLPWSLGPPGARWRWRRCWPRGG